MKMRIFFWSAAVLSLTMAVRSRGGQPPATGSPPPLVAHEELQKRLADPALRLIDAPSEGRLRRWSHPRCRLAGPEGFRAVDSGRGGD